MVRFRVMAGSVELSGKVEFMSGIADGLFCMHVECSKLERNRTRRTTMFNAGKFWNTICGFSAGQVVMYGESSVQAID